MATNGLITSRPTTARALWSSAGGVVSGPLTFLLSGAVTVVYATDGLTWLGLVLAMVLVGVVIVVSRTWPITGFVAGAILAALILAFAVTGMSPSSRQSLGFDGVVVFGGSGLLSAALVAAYLTTAIGARGRSRPNE